MGRGSIGWRWVCWRRSFKREKKKKKKKKTQKKARGEGGFMLCALSVCVQKREFVSFGTHTLFIYLFIYFYFFVFLDSMISLIIN